MFNFEMITKSKLKANKSPCSSRDNNPYEKRLHGIDAGRQRRKWQRTRHVPKERGLLGPDGNVIRGVTRPNVAKVSKCENSHSCRNGVNARCRRSVDCQADQVLWRKWWLVFRGGLWLTWTYYLTNLGKGRVLKEHTELVRVPETIKDQTSQSVSVKQILIIVSIAKKRRSTARRWFGVWLTAGYTGAIRSDEEKRISKKIKIRHFRRLVPQTASTLTTFLYLNLI